MLARSCWCRDLSPIKYNVQCAVRLVRSREDVDNELSVRALSLRARQAARIAVRHESLSQGSSTLVARTSLNVVATREPAFDVAIAPRALVRASRSVYSASCLSALGLGLGLGSRSRTGSFDNQPWCWCRRCVRSHPSVLSIERTPRHTIAARLLSFHNLRSLRQTPVRRPRQFSFLPR